MAANLSEVAEDGCRASGGATQIQRAETAALSAEAQRWFSEGLELLNLGEPRAAVAWFERALEVAPDFADGHVGLGIACAIDSRIYPALDHFERAAELEPWNFFAHFKLGQFYFKLRVPQKGYAEMSRALDCACTLEERKLVAQVLREEKQREHGGVRRPWWNRRFGRTGVLLGAVLGAAAILMLILHLA